MKTILNNYNQLGISVTESARLSLLAVDNTAAFGVIYGHYCTKSGKWYCGKTVKLENPYIRWGFQGHNYSDGRFAKAIKKYGWENFEHFILGVYPIEKLSEMEEFWISEKDSYKNGYNSTEGGDIVDMLGKHHSEETKSKIGAANGRKVSRFKKDPLSKNNFIFDKEYISAAEAARDIGVYGNGQIISCCKGRRKSAKGFIWRYSDEISRDTIITLDYRSTVSYGMKNKNHKAESILKIREANTKLKGRAILKLTLDGNIVEKYPSINDACRINNYSTHSGISKCIRGTARTAYGFRWKYEEDFNSENNN